MQSLMISNNNNNKEKNTVFLIYISIPLSHSISWKSQLGSQDCLGQNKIEEEVN
jgi:hypothetical protein